MVINYQVYLNDLLLAERRLDKKAVKQQIIDTLIQIEGIAKAFDLQNFEAAMLPEPLKTMVTNGYNQKLSGDIQFVYKPQWFRWLEPGHYARCMESVRFPYSLALVWQRHQTRAARTEIYRWLILRQHWPLCCAYKCQMPASAT
jgi:hypothetical protein